LLRFEVQSLPWLAVECAGLDRLCLGIAAMTG
jgi:hypothetical protein